jgi:hypothetical protein
MQKFKVTWTGPHGYGAIVGEFDSPEEAEEVGAEWLEVMNAVGNLYSIEIVPA